jgi:hypothetical protein
MAIVSFNFTISDFRFWISPGWRAFVTRAFLSEVVLFLVLLISCSLHAQVHSIPVKPALPPDFRGPGVKYIVPGEKIPGDTIIGDTYYDTQTYNYGNLMNRIFEFPDGTAGATWMDMGPGGVPDRGTGYNFFDGVRWTGTDPHLGFDGRNGFPNYAPWGDSGELVEHYDYIQNAGVIKILRRDVKGRGAWHESVLAPPAGNHSLVWAAMITSGVHHEFVHLLAYTYDNPYRGQGHALLYYRSPDGGLTWDINGILIPGLDSAYFPTIAPLKYSWAQPRGDTLAFTYGFDQFDGLVFQIGE